LDRYTAIKRYLPLAGIAASALAFLLLAASLGGLELRPGQPIEFGAFGGGGGGGGSGLDIRLLLVSFIWLCILVSAIGLVVSRSLRRHLLRMLPLYVVYGLLMYLLFSWIWSQSGADSGGITPVEPPLAAQPTPPPLAAPPPVTPPEYIAAPPQWLVLTISLLVGLVVVAAIWLVARLSRRAEPENTLAQLAHEAQSALASLEAGAGLRNAVLRCYAEMARVLSGQRGVQTDKTMTPREFETRLAAAGLRDEHIRRLTRLFEAVRYGQREPGEREEREAVECLSAIVAAYGHQGMEHEGTKPRRHEGGQTAG
jgi:hypothetical protein